MLICCDQCIFDRPQHQGQWRAELVTDVGKEGDLGPVEFGQRLGTSPLIVIGPGMHDGGGYRGSE
ncbi:hypothetical protein D9M69_672300 [compost metagenome]